MTDQSTCAADLDANLARVRADIAALDAVCRLDPACWCDQIAPSLPCCSVCQEQEDRLAVLRREEGRLLAVRSDAVAVAVKPSPADAMYTTFCDPLPADFTADPLGYLTRLLDAMPKPQEEMVVVTPSMDALRAAVPMTERAATPMDLYGGLRVVVVPGVTGPRLVPRRSLEFLRGASPLAGAYQDWHALKLVRTAAVERPGVADQADTPVVVEDTR